MTSTKAIADENLKSIEYRHPEVRIYVDKIVELWNPKKVILYGSKARGDAKKGSDSDFAVVTDQPIDADEITGALDVVRYSKAPAELKKIIDEEGVVVYEREK